MALFHDQLPGGREEREASRPSSKWRQWLLRNNHLIMAFVLAVLGVVLAIQGAGAL